MTVEEIQSHRTGTILGRVIHLFETIDSTNTYAKSLVSSGAEEGTVVIAEKQTAGRGRMNREWHSERGLNLTFSVVLRPDTGPETMGLLPLAAGVAVAEAIEGITGRRPSCKWPNDILIDGRKCCGILSESLTDRQGRPGVIVGIGVNVNQENFPDAIGHTATSLLLCTGRSIRRSQLIAAILDRLEDIYAIFRRGTTDRIIERWLAYATMIGELVTVGTPGGSVTGRAEGLSPDGGLIIAAGETRMIVHAGDVTLHINP